jgi:septum formation topological specificity factor MinE
MERIQTSEQGSETERVQTSDQGSETERIQTSDQDSETERVQTSDQGSGMERIQTSEQGSETERVQTSDQGSGMERVETSDQDSETERVQTSDQGSGMERVETSDQDSETERVQTSEQGSGMERVETSDQDSETERIQTSDQGSETERIQTSEQGSGMETVETSEQGSGLDEEGHGILLNDLARLQMENANLRNQIENVQRENDNFEQLLELANNRLEEPDFTELSSNGSQSGHVDDVTQTELQGSDIDDLELAALEERVRNINERTRMTDELQDMELDMLRERLLNHLQRIEIRQDAEIDVLRERVRYLMNADRFVQSNLDYVTALQNEIQELQRRLDVVDEDNLHSTTSTDDDNDLQPTTSTDDDNDSQPTTSMDEPERWTWETARRQYLEQQQAHPDDGSELRSTDEDNISPDSNFTFTSQNTREGARRRKSKKRTYGEGRLPDPDFRRIISKKNRYEDMTRLRNKYRMERIQQRRGLSQDKQRAPNNDSINRRPDPNFRRIISKKKRYEDMTRLRNHHRVRRQHVGNDDQPFIGQRVENPAAAIRRGTRQLRMPVRLQGNQIEGDGLTAINNIRRRNEE